LDEFHLFAHGTSKHIIRLFEWGTKNVYKYDQYTTNYPFDIGRGMLEMAGQDMEASRRTIPRTHFDGNWKNPLNGTPRGVDRLDFLLYIVPTLLIPRISPGRDGEPVKTIMNKLVIACHLALQWKIEPGELVLIER
jgi:hypothetical protein